VKTGELVWFNGEFAPVTEASVPLLTHALHYGTAVFEGMRVYDTSRGPAAFRHDEHVARLIRSAKLYYIEIPWSPQELREATDELVGRNRHRSCYVRAIVFRGTGAMGVSPLAASVEVAIATWEWATYLGEEGKRDGIRAKVSSWRRPGGDTLVPTAKASGHYLNSALAKIEAEFADYDEAILLDQRGMVSEGTGENVFIVDQGVIETPSTSSSILPGITRMSVIEIARDLGWEVRERDIGRSELACADEVFVTGTAAELTPLVEIDDLRVGDGRPGPVTRQLQSTLEDVFRGRNPRYAHWSQPVAQPPRAEVG
jgi:branched-chain amino acid aminotransferase